MAIFTPRWEKYQSDKPAGTIELKDSHYIGERLDMFLPLDGTLQTYGRAASAPSQFIYSGDDTTYLEWASDGLENSSYDGDYIDGMGFATPFQLWDVNDRLIGFQARSVVGGFSNKSFGIGDIENSDTGLGDSYNSLRVVNNDISGLVGNRSATHAGMFLRDGEPHTYVERVTTTGGTRLSQLFRDGLLVSTNIYSQAAFQREATFNVGCGDLHHNRGLNGVVNTAFMINGWAPEYVAEELSAAPYQIIKARRKYWVMPSGATGTTAATASSAGQTTVAFTAETIAAATAGGVGQATSAFVGAEASAVTTTNASSAGQSTDAFTTEAITAATASSTGQTTEAFSTEILAAATSSSTGQTTEAFSTEILAAATASSAGQTTEAFIGADAASGITTATATSVGQATATIAASATAASTATSAGVGVITGVGMDGAATATTGAATGAATVSAVAASIAATTASAAAAAVTTGVSSSTLVVAAVGAVAGASGAAATAVASISAIATAAGTAVATALYDLTSTTVASATGLATVTGYAAWDVAISDTPYAPPGRTFYVDSEQRRFYVDSELRRFYVRG
mgnify:CR=1 FL=1